MENPCEQKTNFCNVNIGMVVKLCGDNPLIFSLSKSTTMLRWTVTFLVVAIIAAILGFGGIAAGAASIAKILFYIFIVLFVLSFFLGRRTVD